LRVVQNDETLSEEAIHFYNKAIDSQKTGNLKEAKKFYLEALKISPKFPQALNNLANIYRKMKKFEEARSLYIKSFRIDRSFSLPIVNIAYLNMEKGEWKRAYHAFKFAFEIGIAHLEKDEICNINLDFGICCLKLSKYHEAIEAFKKSIELNEESLHSHIGLILALREIGEYHEAFREIEKVENLGFKSVELNLLKKIVISNILENN